jgi:flagellar basal body-associated protein FliL
MAGLLEPNANPTTEPQESSLRPILIGIVIVGIVVALLALFFRTEQKRPLPPPAYAANLKFSDLKTSAAQNFVGSTVNYIDGIITNTGDQTVIHATVQVTFKDDLGQTAQREEVPIHVLRSGGPYDEAVDLMLSPLAPRESKPFRLTFENISAQWNHAYPDLKLTQVTVR